MLACASCGTESPDGFKFCPGCGAPLTAPQAALPEERKVVTALFCDLVGFTATSEGADPEDVDRMLTAYFTMARGLIEAHGGVVEKFIGDAVLGVFGVPAAHEDDPERAVRAALRICEDAAGLESLAGQPLRLRVGINTGEVLVRLGVAPGSGERFLAGDTINTASRIQSVAPEMGVAVGLATYEATKQVFEYEGLPPASLKGKAEPVRVFRPTASRARLGVDITRTHRGPFVGREIDLGLLKGLFDKSLTFDEPHLVTVVGEPGLGKSRLVSELLRHADAAPTFVTWRQGRCLPYGDGITYWALGEIVKSHAGILDSDEQATAIARLEAVLPDGPERDWFRDRLLPVIGIEPTTTADRDEQFTAWRRFLEHIAEAHPTVLVFEDIHWADPSMLAFLEHLGDHAAGVPMLIVGTARPELFEKQPQYAQAVRNGTRINLTPLTADDTARLVAALLESTSVPETLRTPVIERSGGNPLYAEEFVRLLRDRELLRPADDGWELVDGADIPFPDTIQALIAARLDTLSADRKAMLADAAVLGKVFWAGAVAAMRGVEESAVIEAMRELAHKELVRPVRRSTMEGESEHAFWHVLTRDVAYAQLPRPSRAARHVAAARWIESKASDRIEDLADVVAHHYVTALELTRAAGQATEAEDLAAPAFRFLTLAGERAKDLDGGAAVAAFEHALELVPEDHPDRPDALVRFGRAASLVGRYREAVDALEAAVDAFRAREDLLSAASAMRHLGEPMVRIDWARATGVEDERLAILEQLPADRELALVLATRSSTELFAGRPTTALALAERALELSITLGVEIASALESRGMARYVLGDRGGLDDFREALSLEQGSLRLTGCYNNLAIALRNIEGPPAALDTIDEGIRIAESRGIHGEAAYLRSTSLPILVGLGRLDDAYSRAASLAEIATAAGDENTLVEIQAIQALVLVMRGRPATIAPFLHGLEARSRLGGRADFIAGGLGAAAVARAALGETAAARALLEEIEATPGIDASQELPFYLAPVVRTAISIGSIPLGERLARHVSARYAFQEHTLIAVDAAIAEARGDREAAAASYADAAARWRDFGVVPEEGYALLGLGRTLVTLGRTSEAREPLRAAAAIFGQRGMAPSLAEAKTLLAD